MNAETITLLIRESSKLGECLSSVALFCRSGSKIQVIFLGEAPCSLDESEKIQLAPFQRSGVEFYTDTPGQLEFRGFNLVNQSEIAALLYRADVVVPL